MQGQALSYAQSCAGAGRWPPCRCLPRSCATLWGGRGVLAGMVLVARHGAGGHASGRTATRPALTCRILPACCHPESTAPLRAPHHPAGLPRRQPKPLVAPAACPLLSPAPSLAFPGLWQVGFLYLRYVCDPRKLWGWFKQYMHDEEVRRTASRPCLALPSFCGPAARRQL